MKLKNLACIASILVASLSGANAATILTTWNFDNVAVGASASPATSAGFGSASAVGFGGSSSPTVLSQAGSSTGGANAWSVGNTGGASVGWNTYAAIGTQGAKFAVSTLGYYQVQVSFDVYAKTNSEAALLVQYSQDGLYWQNASITAAGTAAILATNTNSTNGIVVGSYLNLSAGWNNGVTVDLTGVPGVANDPAFAIRIVNAATGTNCLDVTGALYNSANNGDWTVDNVAFQGVSFDTVANWTFDNVPVNPKNTFSNSPAPAIANNPATAACIGFGTPANHLVSSTFTGGFSTNSADVLTMAPAGPYTSTGTAGANVWRLRGQPGNGWLSTQPIGSQGAEFDVSTLNYTNIIVTFDLYFTTQGEARMCVLYTTDGWVTTNVANLACSSYPTLIQSNTPAGASESEGYSSDIVNGVFIDNTIGSLFYNYLSVDFTGIAGVANNPNFAFRVVNAAQNGECVNFLHQAYNNNSGNARIDNVAVSGQFNGQTAPLLTNAITATVDHPFTNTFSESSANNDVGWHTNISTIYVNGVKLTNTAYTVTATSIIFTPSTNAPALTVAGLDYIVVNATNYTSAKVVQFVNTGVATKLAYTQPAGPTASGGTLTANPVFTVTDQYGNGTTNPYASMVVTATVSNTPATWTLGGATVQSIVNGTCTFTDLTATVNGTTAVTNAAIHFAISGGIITATNSVSFTIGAPPKPFTQGNLAVLQVDTTAANSTFSIIEIKPSAAGQTTPVNINPITATGTNALRISTGGGAGHLALSDDGTFLVFGAYDDGSSATVDQTFNLNRAVGTLNYTNGFTKTGKYVSNSLGGSAVRAACSPDNLDFLIDDKGGLYVYDVNSGQSANVYEQNNYCIRSFGGSAWSLTQKQVALVPSPAVFQFNNGEVGQLDYQNTGYDGPWNITSVTPPPDGLAVDFFMMSTNGSQDPASFAILYTLDQNGGTNGASGVINKWSRNADDSWTAIGAWTNADNGNSLFATTNGNGGVYLYYANGTKDANSIVRVTDASVMGSINIISTNTIYTAPTGNTVIGLAFVPVPAAYAASLIPPPVLTAQATAPVSSTFSVTNTPDDPAWRSAITGITVNGTALPTAAYNKTQAGKLVFDPSQSALLQSSGSKTIVISAAGYSTNSIVQTLAAGTATKLVITTQPTAPAGNGGTLAAQPVVAVQDQYGNAITSTASIAAAVGAGTWTIGGTTSKAAVSGTATFTGLTATSAAAVTGATISFTSSGLTGVTSSAFNVPAPIPSNLSGVALSAGKLKFTFTNVTGLSFSVLATNNLTAPVANWPVVGAAVESPAGSGNYQFTNSAVTNAQLFYILRQP
jgi:hypothetical protein